MPKMLGYTRKELIGTSIREIVPPKHVDSDLVWYKKLVNQGSDDYAVEKSHNGNGTAFKFTLPIKAKLEV